MGGRVKVNGGTPFKPLYVLYSKCCLKCWLVANLDHVIDYVVIKIDFF